MSGGHYDYLFYRIGELADSIERDFHKGGEYISRDWNDLNKNKVYNYLEDADVYQKRKILEDIHKLIEDMRSCEKRAKALEWFMSGDTGIEDLMESLQTK